MHPALKPLVSSLAIAAVAMAPLPATERDSWASFRGADGTGQAASPLPPGAGPLVLNRSWQRPLGSGYSGVSIADGRLVTAIAAAERDYVVALDPADGAELWRYDLAPTYAGHDGSHDGPISTPAISAGRVFMLSPWGHVAAVDLATGNELWTAHLVDDLGCEAPYYGFGGSPAVFGDLMLLQVGGAEGSVAAFDAATGELRWRSFGDESDTGSQSPIVAEIAGREQILVLGSSRVAGLDPADGSALWELAFDTAPGPMGSYTQSPVPIDDSRIFIKHQDGATMVIEIAETAAGLEAKVVSTGRGLARSYSPAALAGDRLFGYSARFLSALDPSSGELLWRSRDPGDGFLLSVGDRLAVITKTGSLHLGAASAEGWQEDQRLQLFSDLAWTPPSYADGAIYVRSLGEVARIDLVRQPAAQRAAADAATVPTVLAGLTRDLSEADDPGRIVADFLSDRELPLIDGNEVVFLWHGEAKDVAIGGDMIGMRREEPMQRLAGTNLWWWTTKLDRRARISYLFFVDYQPATDPTHQRTTSSTILGPDMNWFRGEAVEMSWFAMPEWPGLGIATTTTTAAAAARGRLESFEISLQPPTPEDGDVPEAVTVPVEVWLPPGYDETTERYPTVYLHNTFARRAGAWPETLDRVVGRTVAPVIAVFPNAPRMRGFGKLFVEQLVPHIDQRFRTRAERTARANVGMGWPGLNASMLTFDNPEVFGLLGIQSLFLLEDPLSGLLAAIGDSNASTLPLTIYLEWGRWDLISPHEEMNMRDFSRQAWDLFTDRGWQPIGGEVWDSTDFASWRNRTDVLLESLFPLAGSEGSLAVWQTAR